MADLVIDLAKMPAPPPDPRRWDELLLGPR
jgi:hypothetical protein